MNKFWKLTHNLLVCPTRLVVEVQRSGLGAWGLGGISGMCGLLHVRSVMQLREQYSMDPLFYIQQQVYREIHRAGRE